MVVVVVVLVVVVVAVVVLVVVLVVVVVVVVVIKPLFCPNAVRAWQFHNMVPSLKANVLRSVFCALEGCYRNAKRSAAGLNGYDTLPPKRSYGYLLHAQSRRLHFALGFTCVRLRQFTSGVSMSFGICILAMRRTRGI